MIQRLYAIAAPLVLAIGVGACGDDAAGPEDGGTLAVLLTDAPSDYIESARVWISRIYVVPAEDGEEGRVDLFMDAENPKEYDLLTLRDGVTADLTGDVAIPAGAYGQLRLVVDRAEVQLRNGVSFRDGATSASLQTPSAHSSGIKVQLSSAVESESGQAVTLLVDFDVDDNFVLQGNPEAPEGLQGISFTPVLREKSREVVEDPAG